MMVQSAEPLYSLHLWERSRGVRAAEAAVLAALHCLAEGAAATRTRQLRAAPGLLPLPQISCLSEETLGVEARPPTACLASV